MAMVADYGIPAFVVQASAVVSKPRALSAARTVAAKPRRSEAVCMASPKQDRGKWAGIDATSDFSDAQVRWLRTRLAPSYPCTFAGFAQRT